MAVFFRLYRKCDLEHQNPVKFSDVDDELCAHLGVLPNENEYYRIWYDIEGFSIAMGRNWEHIRETWPERKEIHDFLEANFNSDNWRS